MSLSKKPDATSNKGFIYSVNAALEGVVNALKAERNMRIHFIVAFLVLLCALYIGFSSIEFMLLLFAVSFVLVSEMFNTAIEHLSDFISPEIHPSVKFIKDIAAGAVFVSAVNASLTGYLLFVKRAGLKVDNLFVTVKQSSWNITLIALLVVVGLVLFIKILRKEENLLRGGMPSGHSAVAFSVWMLVSLFTGNAVVSGLVLLLALIVVRSRLAGGVHSAWEIVAGSLLGGLLTLLIFQVLY